MIASGRTDKKMSSAEETQSTPAEAPATEVQAPAEMEESMDTSPVPAPVHDVPAPAETTESVPDPAPAQTSEKPPAVETQAQPAPVVTEPSQTIPKTDSGKFIRPAKPLIKPPVPKKIQTDRPSKQVSFQDTFSEFLSLTCMMHVVINSLL